MSPKNTTEKRRAGKRHSLAETLRVALRERFGVCAGERIGVAVSGGADSVALLRLCVELRETMGIVPCGVHLNHGLRGKASEADEKFVAKLAAQHDMEFFVARENVAAKAKRERANLEDAGRRARYTYFEQLVKEGRVARVAVAHTAEDQAETVLAHMLRGSGLAGLGGIHPVSGSVIRPLLDARRADLRAYLRSKKQAWREDTTNKDVTRTRARIRLQLLPVLEKKFNAAVVEHLCQLAGLAREDNANLEIACELRLSALAKEGPEGIAIAIRDITLGIKPPATGSDQESNYRREGARSRAKRMVRQLVMRVKPRAGELGARHVEAVLHLATCGHSGQLMQLPGGVQVRREREALVFRAAEREGEAGGKQKWTGAEKRKTAAPECSIEVRLPATGETLRLDTPSRILRLRVIDWPLEGRETKECRAVLDRERLRVPLVLRHWQPGDAMRPVGHQKRHTLARLLNELGRTRWEKETWPVLTSAGKVAWALGLPVAEEFAIAKESRAGVVITEESAT